MSQLIFTHPNPHVGTLRVNVKPDQIIWSYGLNTANYPTYGGEVVQILSCYIDDLSVQGTVKSYREMEGIYKYFIHYIQMATQGRKGQGSFIPKPLVMNYPERGWTFRIIPKSLPSFKYGRDVVAPTWAMTAAVSDPDQNFKDDVLEKAEKQAIENEGNFTLFGKITGLMTFNQHDPFSDPSADTKQVEKQFKINPDTARNAWGDLGDWYNNLIPSYLQGDFKDLNGDFSVPSFVQRPNAQQQGGKGSGGKSGSNSKP